MPIDYLATIKQILTEKRPDLDLREIQPFFDLFVRPHQSLLSPLAGDIDTVRGLQSVLGAETMAEAELDRIVANLFITRRTGSKAAGTARVYVSTPATLRFTVTDRFVAQNGLIFSPARDTTFTEAMVRLNPDGSLFFVDLAVIATIEGVSHAILAHQLSSFDGPMTPVKIDNPYPFSKGADRETNAELVARAADAVTTRVLGSGRSIRTLVTEGFPTLSDVGVIGYLDPEMQRDIINCVHTGGRGDIFVLAADRLSQGFGLSAADGHSFALPRGSSASPLPVVQVTSVRKKVGASIASGPGLRRTPETRVTVRSVHPTLTDRVTSPSTAAEANGALLAITGVRAGQIETSIFDLFFGAARVDRFAVASTAAAATLTVFAAKKLLIVWGEATAVKYRALTYAEATTGSTLTAGEIQTLTAAPLSGEASLDYALDPDGTVWLAAAISGAVSLYHLDMTGRLLAPPLGISATGDSARSPSVGLSGAGGARRLLVAYLAGAGDIKAVLSSASGARLSGTAPKLLVSNGKVNRTPVLRADPTGDFHLYFVEGTSSVRTARYTNTTATLIPPRPALSRLAAMDGLTGVADRFGYVYLAWSEPVGDFTDIFLAKLDDTGKLVGGPHNIDRSAYFSNSPALTRDALDNLHLVFTDEQKGKGRTFYTKVAPQEYHLEVLVPEERFSAREEVNLIVEQPATDGIETELVWAPAVLDAQSYVSGDSDRPVISDLLVRHRFPVVIDITCRFRSGTLTAAAAKVALSSYLAGLKEAALESARLIDVLVDAGASGVYDLLMTARIDTEAGAVDIETSTERIPLPRTGYVVAGALSVTRV